MTRKLVVNDGRRERELLLVGTMVVGRDPTCDISDADPLLSRRHVEFVASAPEVTVRDLGSRNGILINGVKIAQSVLRAGDVVQVGHLQVRLIEDTSPVIAPSDETALTPQSDQRTVAPSTGRRPAVWVDAATMGTRPSMPIDEPTQRVVRPDFNQNQATIDTELDRTIPTIPPADRSASNPAVPDPEKTRFAGIAAEQTVNASGTRAVSPILRDPDPDKTRFEPQTAPPHAEPPRPPVAPKAPKPVVPPVSLESAVATALPPDVGDAEIALAKSAVLVRVVSLSAVVFLVTAIPLILFPATGVTRVGLLIVLAFVALGAAWFAAGQIHRQAVLTLAEPNRDARRRSGRGS